MPTAVVTGGFGFLGSHLCRTLLDQGWNVCAVDNLLTGAVGNVGDLMEREQFTHLVSDVCEGIDIPSPVDAVLHFASAASPKDYLAHPLETLKVGSAGTAAALELATRNRARFLLASTSEVYGNPLVHPQSEAYWGNVNPVGPRSVYDEAKRFSEALAMGYHRVYGLDVKIVRIFNTYGPGLRPADGRAIPNFVHQALNGLPLTMFGDGTQTRSFCFVSDEVDGILALLDSPWIGPMNIGNPEEVSMIDVARLVLGLSGSDSTIRFEALPTDDPIRRRPDVTLANKVLGWRPTISISEGLERTIDWFRQAMPLAVDRLPSTTGGVDAFGRG